MLPRAQSRLTSVPDDSFRGRVIGIVVQIPMGRVMTYGQIAVLVGNSRSARIVGGIAHFGDPALPWHRVVAKNGRLATGFPGGRVAHAAALRLEGISIADDHTVEYMEKVLWQPR